MQKSNETNWIPLSVFHFDSKQIVLSLVGLAWATTDSPESGIKTDFKIDPENIQNSELFPGLVLVSLLILESVEAAVQASLQSNYINSI